jgi:hypothetical protein
MVAGLSLPRMIIGTNWFLGWSHTSAAADHMINARNRNRESIAEIIETFLQYDIDAVMAPIAENPVLAEGAKIAEDKTGKHVILIDTPRINVDDNENARREAAQRIKSCKDIGAELCLLHHSSVEQLVNKNTETINRLPDYLAMVRDNEMFPGLSALMPEQIIYADQNGYDVETYIQIYNCMGFMMQIEVESVNNIIWKARKPVMTIKPMAAGRTSPFIGLNFVYNTIRPIDMVTVGCLTPEEADEDVEYAMAAIERRWPDVEGRHSPNKTAIMK